MIDREKVIKGLEYCIDYAQRAKDLINDVPCKGCPYVALKPIAVGQGDCMETLFKDALALLKTQEPRVMTMEEIRDIYYYREDHVWPFATPPYLWVEANGRTAPYWMSWNNVIACLEGQFPKYDPDDYGESWRYWTSRPTDAQMRETPWRMDEVQ